MIRPTIRNVVILVLLAASTPMLAADTPIVDPELRAGTWTATATEVDIGGRMPPGAAAAVEQTVRKPRRLCYNPRRTRDDRARSLLEEFAGSACTAERATVSGQGFNGKMVCADESTEGSTSYEGTFDTTHADVELTIDMSFKKTEWRMFMTTRVKFEWLSEGCDDRQ
jgi:Protein of unknown function (DUF3617)